MVVEQQPPDQQQQEHLPLNPNGQQQRGNEDTDKGSKSLFLFWGIRAKEPNLQPSLLFACVPWPLIIDPS